MRKSIVCVTCLLMFASRTVSALELGAIEARSALYEPLDARIALHDVRIGDIEGMRVTLGSRSQFEAAGVPRPFHLTLIEFAAVREGEDGHIHLRTYDPVIEPFLTFLIDVDWPGGHAIRGYNLDLAPAARGVTGAVTTRRPERGRGSDALSATPDSPAAGGAADAAATTPTSPAAVVESRPAGGSTYGPVRRNETLWPLASRLRPDDSVSVHRMMLALLEANPEAFYIRNINALSAGVTLRIPTRDEIGPGDRAAAVAEVKRQNLAWREYREGRRRASTTVRTEPAAARAPAPTPAAPTPDSAPSSSDAGTPPGGRLEVLSPGPSPDAATGDEGADVRTLRNELSIAMEEADAKRLENEEIRSRLIETENHIKELYRLIKLKDEEIAALKAMVDAQPAPEPSQAPAAAPSEAAPTPASDPSETEQSMIAAAFDMLLFKRDVPLSINSGFLVWGVILLLVMLGVTAMRRRHATAGR